MQGKDQQQTRKAVPPQEPMRQLIHSMLLMRSCARSQQQAAGVAASAASAVAAAAAPAAALQHSGIPGPLAVCSCTALSADIRSYVTSASPCKAAQSSDIPEQGGSYYWAPPDQGQCFTLDRRSIHERRATGTVSLSIIVTSRQTLHGGSTSIIIPPCPPIAEIVK